MLTRKPVNTMCKSRPPKVKVLRVVFLVFLFWKKNNAAL